jgi:gamma-glutamylcyclotransferase (GGCT)/AIG2-like uncharacterized protein YtfP
MKRKFDEEKWIHFCTQYGVFAWRMRDNASKVFEDMHESVVTFCLTPKVCNHPEDSDTHGFVEFPFQVGLDDVRCFHTFVIRPVEHLHVWPPMITGDINFQTVLRMFDFFQTDKRYAEKLLASLNELEKFQSAVSAMSAFKLHPRTLTKFPLNFIHLESFSVLDRFEFAHAQKLDNLMYKPRIIQQPYIAELLGLEPAFLECLDQQSCVIAGGAALKIGCPDSRFTDRCDVDFFVFHNSQQIATIKNILHLALATGRRIFKSGAVFTAVGKLGTRRLQVVVSCYQSGEALVSSFDANEVSACYDGHTLHATCGAQHAWITKKSVLKNPDIVPIRLYGLVWKGFELSTDQIEILKKSKHEWPVCERSKLIYENAMPILVDDVPQTIQDANICQQYGLDLVPDIDKIDVTPLAKYDPDD